MPAPRHAIKQDQNATARPSGPRRTARPLGILLLGLLALLPPSGSSAAAQAPNEPAAPIQGTAAMTGEKARQAMAAGDFAEAYCLWRRPADAGDAEAQFAIGWMYHNGYGLSIDDARAVEWWRRAASQGHADAHFALGNLFRTGGKDLPRDRNLAIDHLLKADPDSDAGLLLRGIIAENHASIRARIAALLQSGDARLGSYLRVDAALANLRAGPGTPHPILATLQADEQVLELHREGRWHRVARTADGLVGWIHESLLAKAAPTGARP